MKSLSNPLISLVIPVYNVEDYLSECLESVVKQSYKNLEIILVDDGSRDKSPEICDHYAGMDKRIKVVHQSNQGLAKARNAGLSMITGEYVGFVDSDDWIAEDMYEYLYTKLVTYDAEVAVCPHYVAEGKTLKASLAPDGEQVLTNVESIRLLADRKLMYNFVWDKLYKRELWENIRFPEGRIFEDVYVIHQVLYRAQKVVLTDQAKYYYRTRSGSITNYKYKAEREFQILEAFHQQCVFGMEKNIWDNIPLKPLRTCIHLINHLTVAENSETNREFLDRTLAIMHQYDFLTRKEIGFAYCLKRYLINRHYTLYSVCYRGFHFLFKRNTKRV